MDIATDRHAHLRAAFSAGCRIQAWHLNDGAASSNDGRWDTLTPPEGRAPEFGCAPHLYRVHPEDAPRADDLQRSWVPRDNDGKEQDAFEAWAKAEAFDMAQHPLHWLFLNERTNAARKGWRGALAYVSAAMQANGGRP